MASEVTQRQRAERLLHDLTHVDTEWKCCLEHPQSIEKIMAFAATAREEALREAAERLGVGDSNGLLAAPCLWCGYNGEGYYQAGTHGKSCPWNTIGGCDERLDRLAREGVK